MLFPMKKKYEMDMIQTQKGAVESMRLSKLRHKKQSAGMLLEKQRKL